VPVMIKLDEGNVECEMVAGVIGMRVSCSGLDLHGRPGEKGMDTLAVEPGWWMVRKGEDGDE
jgi:hypothetical protein